MAGQVMRCLLRRSALLVLVLVGLGGALGLSAGLAAPGTIPVPAAKPSALPVKGMVTMVDLGAKTCIPCKMMAPILDELEKQYRGRAAVVFLDVREQQDQVSRFGIRAIPTQIFYDKTGREVSRHEGFLDKKSIADQLDKLLAR